jgi:hypothetical protein
MHSNIQELTVELPVDAAEVILEHFGSRNPVSLASRVHELGKAIHFLKDVHRRLESGYQFEGERGLHQINEIGLRIRLIEKENKYLLDLLVKALKTAEKSTTLQ